MKNEEITSMILISIVITVIEQIAQFSLKKSNKIFDTYYINGIVFYILVAVVFHYIYNNYNANKVNIVWACISIILAVFLGYLIEDEKITFNKILAVIFAILAIFFVQ